MWFLLIALLSVPPHTWVLKAFDTLQTCQLERDRIGFEMAEAYPNERTFTIECQFRAVRSRPILALH